MAHEIWDQKFYGRRQAAWHGLGVVNDQAQGAVETLNMLGDYEVRLMPLKGVVGKQVVKTDFSHVVRMPTPTDDQIRIFGNPVRDYELITPMQAAEMFDAKVGADIETMALLAKGERMFITCVLPTHNVGGFDEVKNYLLFDNPMKPDISAGAYVTGVRTVCMNTLRAGIDSASAAYRINHRKGAAERLGNWLETRYQMAVDTLAVVGQAYDLMVKKQVSAPDVKWIADTLYPIPQQPDMMRPRKTAWELIEKEWKAQVERQQQYRTAVVNLWDGGGMGLDDRRIRGTGWAAFNAVAEVESWRRTNNPESVVTGLMAGDRAQKIQKAYTLVMEKIV